jgi:hypothetical protein
VEARHLIQSASYGPEVIKAMTQAFDEAWLAVAGNFSQGATEAAKLRLAASLLSVASEGSRDVKGLTIRAITTLALSYHTAPSKLSK